MALSSHDDNEALEFLRRRVAKFGLFTGAFVFLFWVFRLLTGEELGSFHSVTHLGSAVVLVAAWLVLEYGRPSRPVIRTVETVALCGSSALLIVMGTKIPNL